MNDGDPNNPTRGRAQVPGSSGGHDYDDGPPVHGARPGGGPGPTTGRASVGGSSGRASVGGPGGGAAAGRAQARTSVPPPSGETGRARVPSQSGGTAGRASVGRASIRSGGVPPGGDIIDSDGPHRRPPRGGPPSGAAAGRAKRKRRRNWILGSFAVLIMLAGTTVVGGTFFYDDVALPSDLPQQQQATTIFFSDNKTQMGKIGNENRTIVPDSQIQKPVRDAVVATEDKTFYENSGISFTGILRAAWNNVTGGTRQGASTITQQYARNIADLKGITYSRKLREAVIAMKLNDTYDKDVILTAYLNTVYFGRQSYGIEAAAQSYFGKNAKDLTLEEGMALAAMIKNPAGGPNGLSFYDGTVNPQQATDRFQNYIKPNLVEMKVITPQQAATMQYPKLRTYDPSDPAYQAQWGLDKPTGNVLHNVVDELTHLKNAKGDLMFPDLEGGGYRIVTTIDKGMQDAAEKYASGATKDSPLFGQANAVAAMVSVEPYSGRVKAYYGGPNGADQDRAGVWRDGLLTKEKPDVLQGFGRHPPASSFKIYTLGAALRDGVSMNSRWDGSSPKKFPERAKPVENAEGKTACAGGDKNCTLKEATVESLNVPFYSLAKTVTPKKVMEFARDAGIRYMWNTEQEGQPRYDLTAGPAGLDSAEIGFGQYPVTVLDHANGVATMAARGSRAQAHFVAQVFRGSALVYKEVFKPAQVQGFSKQMADDINAALEQVLTNGTAKNMSLSSGRAAAAKTGTWQAEVDETGTKPVKNQNSNAWMVGFVAPDLTKKSQFYGLASAVWVGSKVGDSAAVKINGNALFGANAGGPIWKKFMDQATAGMPKTKFPDAKNVGDDKRGDSTEPLTPAPPAGGGQGDANAFCQQFPQLCPGGGNGGGNGNGNNNGNGNGGGNGNPNDQFPGLPTNPGTRG